MSVLLEQMMQAGLPRHRSEALYETPENRSLWLYQPVTSGLSYAPSILHTTEIQWMLVGGSPVVTAEQHV